MSMPFGRYSDPAMAAVRRRIASGASTRSSWRSPHLPSAMAPDDSPCPGPPGAAHLSLGGLYHYFPTKRDLVLHALKPEAVARLCADFHGRHADLERSDPGRYVQADVAYMARQCFFLRPAFQAALELDAEVAWDHIQASIEGGLESCTRPLAYALPECTPEEIRRLGRSVRRTFFSALVDRTVTPEELRHELLSLIHGLGLTWLAPTVMLTSVVIVPKRGLAAGHQRVHAVLRS
jgi:AcrR family transcriptional regulator